MATADVPTVLVPAPEREEQKKQIDDSLIFLEDRGLKYTGKSRPPKAYDNRNFLHSRCARHIRIMCEYMETQQRLRNEKVLFSLLFFGSARALSRQQWEESRALALKMIETGEQARGDAKLEHLNRIEWLCDYYDKAHELAKLISAWSFTPEGQTATKRLAQYVPSPVTLEGDELAPADLELNGGNVSPLVMCSGGGGGMMEAANHGAVDGHPCARTMGMGISLPFESGLNKYVTDGLGFEFHYFFTRKFWMVYIALGLVVCPGGVGTMDELFEFITLKQTGKIKRHLPVVLLGKEYWRNVVNFDFLISKGVMSADDLEDMLWTDDPQEAFEHIRQGLTSDRIIQKNQKWLIRYESQRKSKENKENDA